MITVLENKWIVIFFRKNNGLKDLLYGLWHTILHRCDEQEVTSNKRGSGITFIIVKTLHF